jgi:hypothetical protein
MQNLTTIGSITALLTHWRVYTELSSSVQLNDVNNTNEDLSGLVLNKIYSWELENLNNIKPNYPAIDLGDLANAIGVSVTATSASTYIHDKIKTNIEHKVYESYPNHHFFITTRKLNYTSVFDTQGKYVFDKDKHIIDIEDLLKKIKTLGLNVQKEVLGILEENVSRLRGSFIEDVTPQDIAKILNEFSAQQPELINNISVSIKNLNRTEITEKNAINNLSEEYFNYIQQESLPFFDQINEFLEHFSNRNLKKIYFNITSDLQKIILTRRNEFQQFDEIFTLIEENSKKMLPSLVDDRRIFRILLHFMYFQCDIGLNK